MKAIVITSGYFNPLHPGHIECFELCKALGDELWVIVNNDHQAKLKTGKSEVFQNENFRMKIISSLRVVDEAFLAIDEDLSVCASLEMLYQKIREKYGEEVSIVFGKGGDRFVGNIPEVAVCEKYGILIRDGLGQKTHNSSDFRVKGF